jgi:poly(A) polymerase
MLSKLDFNSKALMRLLTILGEYSTNFPRIVGGCIRDKLLNLPITDIDINTEILPQEVIKILQIKNIKAIPTGIEFGTVTGIVDGEKFEITTLREDIQNDGRWPVVKYCKDFYLDAARRDFTINALSYCVQENKLYDYFGGLEHLHEKKVIFIGEANERIQEDYLRILRFFRFSMRFASKLDTLGYKACCDNSAGLAKISKERINAEFTKILNYNDYKCVTIIEKMQSGGILNVIFPNISIKLDAFESGLKIMEEKTLQLSIEGKYGLIFANENNYERLIIFFKDFKFSNNQIKKLSIFIKLKISNDVLADLHRLWYIDYRDIADYIIFCFSLNLISDNVFLSLLDYFNQKPPKFPVTSNVLINMGYKEAKLGKAIKFLQDKWLLSLCTISLDDLLKLLK